MRIHLILFACAVFPVHDLVQAQSVPNVPTNQGTATTEVSGLKKLTSTGGLEVISDTQGVNFKPWMVHWRKRTQRTWDALIPEEVKPPTNKSGVVIIRFKVLPSGRLMEGSMALEGRSGDTALDRAAWGALTGSNYPPLPKEFHGPYLELRAGFRYNMEPPL